MLYVDTKTLNIEHKLDSSDIDVEDVVGDVNHQNLRKILEFVNTFQQILKWKMEDTEFSTLPCHPLTFPRFLSSTIN